MMRTWEVEYMAAGEIGVDEIVAESRADAEDAAAEKYGADNIVSLTDITTYAREDYARYGD
jgi:hypothetical protein